MPAETGTTNRKIRILFLIDFFVGSSGGTENHLAYLAQFLNKDHFQCWIVVFHLEDNQLIQTIRNSGTPVIHLPVERYYGLMALVRAFQLRKLIKEKKIDLVQTFHFKSDFYGALVASWSGVKHIVSSKRDVGHAKKPLHFYLSSKVRHLFQGIIAVSHAVGEMVVVRENIEAGKLKVIHNGVDLRRFQPPTREERLKIRSEIGLEPDDFVVGMAGVFRPEKNFHILMDGAQKAATSIPKLKILAIGGGPLQKSCQRQCERLGISDKVIFTGITDDMPRYLKALDVACLVSKCEGLSNSILEKMATGLPLIATQVGGNPEVVITNFNGLLIPPDDSDALSEAILKLYTDPNEREKMGFHSRQRAEDYFSMRKMIDQHEDYYHFLLSSRGVSVEEKISRAVNN